MVGLREIVDLPLGKLVQHFTEAKRKGHDFMILYNYTGGVEGISDLFESTVSFAASDERSIDEALSKYGFDCMMEFEKARTEFRPLAIYFLANAFEDEHAKARKRDIETLPDQVKDRIEQMEEYYRFIRKPLFERILGSKPKWAPIPAKELH